MLLRAYRLTDKLGLIILKGSQVLVDTILDGLHILITNIWRVLLTVFGGLFVILLGIGRVLWLLVRQFARVVAAIGALALLILNFFLRLTGHAARTAGGTTTDAMARRAARAQMQASLAEDPLRTQNRILSGLTVLLLAVLIGVVLWATRPAPSAPQSATTFNNFNPANFAPVDSGSGPNVAAEAPLPTLVPTATALPTILEVRGSLAYTVRENGQTDIWGIGVGTRAPIRLTNNPADDRDPAWSPDGRQLAYASHQDGNWELYIYDLNTGDTLRMTYDQSFQGSPQWSPDGEWLVYESYQGNNLDIYIMRVDGSQPPLRLPGSSDAPDFSPSWSPDGRRISFISWRDGNQDVYIFSLDDPRPEATLNLTNTPDRGEDFPAWSPDGKLLAYSAMDEGLEKVFVKPVEDQNAVAQVIGRGRTPAWSPDSKSLVFAVDSEDSTHLVASPFAGEGVTTEIIPVSLGASDPSWTAALLPPSLVNSGGLAAGVVGPLYIEQEVRLENDPPFRLNPLINVEAPNPVLSDRVNDAFNALREETLQKAGWDFLGQLEDAFWRIDRPPQPGEERRSWHMAGRAFAMNRNAIVGFPAPVEIVREDIGVETYWRVYVRVAEEAQSGQLGEPLRRMPWDFASRNQGDVEAYDQGGRLRSEMPVGYYVDLTQIAADYGWDRAPAGNDWRANFNSTNYWLFRKTDGLDWLTAMRELYAEGQLGGFSPRPTNEPSVQLQSTITDQPAPTTAPTESAQPEVTESVES